MTSIAAPPNQRQPTEHDLRAVSSPFRDMLGARIVEWMPDRCVVEIPISRPLTNFAGALAGPVVAAAVDMAATLSGCFTPKPQLPLLAVTVNFSVSFVAPITGEYVRAVARKVGGGKRLFTATVDVAAADGSTVAVGQGSFRYVPRREPL